MLVSLFWRDELVLLVCSFLLFYILEEIWLEKKVLLEKEERRSSTRGSSEEKTQSV